MTLALDSSAHSESDSIGGDSAVSRSTLSKVSRWFSGRKSQLSAIDHAEITEIAASGEVTSTSPKFFGGELRTILQRGDDRDGVPDLVAVMMGKLMSNDNEGLKSEGVFRVPGDTIEMREMREAINQGADARQVIGKCCNVHSVAGLFKMFFRELEEPILSFALYDDLIRVASGLHTFSSNTDVTELQSLLLHLPDG